ncbi:type II toxin-antitoxin system VapC family toxin [Calothrix sp. FACHB-1219]|uniref:type II toxin-antitoxin system VapC family toxin n=1 Tax=unclassified Calothrix TaxID=2619626 RepID=UPI0016893949|nr:MULTISPECIES: type II toxin-antitoxin system VapC family toxin [unclassified Calothrix]MBD2203557.1 type II toxin-antitoxin system VapC family toxin [Calothrix sp. FACHB-168]MBD2221168.1 type II toxin-antitoxin system VapC family toxin [Calothrix sp. FACHB-1219]
MIILDTHIWIWWIDNNARLTQKYRDWIAQYQSQGLGISIISCWEVAKLVENNKLSFSISVDDWLTAALAYPGVQLLELTIPIIVESTKLTGFHKDPFDQVIVATARIYGCQLVTVDTKILAYSGVQTLK